MPSKKKTQVPQGRMKQSKLLGGLARYEKPTRTSTSVLDLEDSDPYKFVNSQSIDPGEGRSTRLQLHQTPRLPSNGASTSIPTPARGGPKKGSSSSSRINPTPTPVGARKGGNSSSSSSINPPPTPAGARKGKNSSLSASSTPVHHGASSKKGKNKRSPAALTEDERLKLQEEEDLKRALEASRQEQERQDRKRKREEAQLEALREEEEEGEGGKEKGSGHQEAAASRQEVDRKCKRRKESAAWRQEKGAAELDRLQERVQRTIALVDSASTKNLTSSSKPAAAVAGSVDLVRCAEEVTRSDNETADVGTPGMATVAATTTDVMCEDPPTLSTVTACHSPPPLTPTKEPASERPVLGSESQWSIDATPPIEEPTMTMARPRLSLSQVSVKKLSVKRPRGRGGGEGGGPSVSVTPMEAWAGKPTTAGPRGQTSSPLTSCGARGEQEKEEASKLAGDSPSTPLLIRHDEQPDVSAGAKCTSSGKKPVRIGGTKPLVIPGLPTSEPREAGTSEVAAVVATVPVSKGGETMRGGEVSEEASRQVRRKLSLSYNKKQSAHGPRQQFRVGGSGVRKTVVDETVEILCVDETRVLEETGDPAHANLTASVNPPPSISSDPKTATSPSKGAEVMDAVAGDKTCGIAKAVSILATPPIEVATTPSDGAEEELLGSRTKPPAEEEEQVLSSDGADLSSNDAEAGPMYVDVEEDVSPDDMGTKADTEFSDTCLPPSSTANSLHSDIRALAPPAPPVAASSGVSKRNLSLSPCPTHEQPPKRSRLGKGLPGCLDAKTRQVLLRLRALRERNAARELAQCHAPPPTHAPAGVPPTKHSKVIVGSFDSYFSQLARAQSSVLHRVKWGVGVCASAKQPATSLVMPRRARGRPSPCSWLDDLLKLSLQIASKTRSARASPSGGGGGGVLLAPDFKFRLSEEEEEEEDGSVVGGRRRRGRTGGKRWGAGGGVISSDGESASDGSGDLELEVGDQEIIGGCSEDFHVMSPGTATAMEVEGEGEGQLGDSEYREESNFEPILIGTQDEPTSRPARECSEERAVERADDRASMLDPILARTSPASRGSKLPLVSNRGSGRGKRADRPPREEEQDRWLSSRKPPPRKTKPRATPKPRPRQSKKATPTQPKGRKGGGGGGSRGKGSAAARLILSARKSAQANKVEEGGGALEEEKEEEEPLCRGKGRGQGGRGGRRRRVSSSSEGSEEEEEALTSRHKTTTLTTSKNSVIDLTEESLASADHQSESVSCPICHAFFCKSEIEAHVNECLRDVEGEREGSGGGGGVKCSLCGKEVNISLLQTHEDQCGGRGSSEEGEEQEERQGGGRGHDKLHGGVGDSDEGEGTGLFPIKRRQLMGTRLAAGSGGCLGVRQGAQLPARGKAPGSPRPHHHQASVSGKAALRQLPLSPSPSPSSSGSDVNFEEVMEFSCAGGNRGGAISRYADREGEGEEIAVSGTAESQAIPCEDGGFAIDPTSISSSPIRCFTRLDDMAPEERVRFQNQFRTKGGSGRGKQQLSFRQRSQDWPGRDSFDALRDGGRYSGGGGGGIRSNKYYGKKKGQGKAYWKKKTSRK